ncbi:hypothetical protein LTR02_003165 [Friedmanniomyces endolithicus]|nr:hypothetical protein LTR94_005325 [Friedmanniomyces endolithicus]KAK0793550.1 hypothetical protein LTR59_008172 [Friedmanniomyces endolithicus]KAK0801530.1 hypothetical protein LTR38_006836 [Friedmanniomyces endolithicus]KAK0815565.1 hypothetical protein LTR75_003853 [Friedmanniomyces endolithicus]KAK0842738.1 hypothetical protein LTR03_009078 [Friedmanniomyces endolithicus]
MLDRIGQMPAAKAPPPSPVSPSTPTCTAAAADVLPRWPLAHYWSYCRACLRCASLLLPWLAELLVADLLLSLLLPVSVVLPDTCYHASSRIAESIWRGIQAIFTRANRARIVVSGAEGMRHGESVVLVANHVGWADFYMIQELALKAGMLGRCRWFAKQQLRWVPFLGWGLWAMGMCLVSREWTHDREEMERVFRGVVERRWPVWLIAYSEATRYTSAKRLEAEAWCRDHDKRLGQYLLYPRTKGFIACVQNLRKTEHVSAVYDVTIAYAKDDKEFQVPPRFTETLMLPNLDERWRFFVHVERYAIAELPHSDAELALWLEDRWVEKGQRLAHLRKLLLDGQKWDESSLSGLRLD